MLFAECGKGFRYKVSQRSHKCNPSIIASLSITPEEKKEAVEIYKLDQGPHDLCLDDLIRDNSYDKVMKNETNVSADILYDSFHGNSDIKEFQNRCKNSNYNNFNTNFSTELETINEDSFKELLGAL